MAVWLNMLEPIFFHERDRDGLLIIALDHTPVAEYARKHYRSDELLLVSSTRPLPCPTFDELLTETDLADRLMERSVTQLAVPYRTKKEYRVWARAHHITLITPSAHIQNRLENKRAFQRLLEGHGVRTPAVLRERAQVLPGKTYVIQKSVGSGMLGTEFLRADDVRDIHFTRSTLVREYVEGIPIGVSIIIDRAGIAIFSATRRQCFEYENGFPKTFLGIQWLPADFLSKQTIESIRHELMRVCSLLHTASFAGMANIDLVIAHDRAYVLECNPRLSASTPQLFSVPGLTAHAEPWPLYVRACLRKRFDLSNTLICHIPKSPYMGSTLDIDVPACSDTTHVPPVGTYRLTPAGVSFVEKDRHLSDDHNTFFLFHELSEPHTRIQQAFTLASIYSNTPLYDHTTGTLNAHGSKLRTAVCTLFGYHPTP